MQVSIMSTSSGAIWRRSFVSLAMFFKAALYASSNFLASNNEDFSCSISSCSFISKKSPLWNKTRHSVLQGVVKCQ